ncbi:MAG: hypothetical protein K2Q22_11805, partial [Cytophagales bacterium]|nr:hypothetical protein [Cytophagales bacterium]
MAVFFKINYSSAGIWRQVLNDGKSFKKHILWGSPRQIRSDEWLVTTPSMLSQYYHGFPESNPTIGAKNSPLIMDQPVNNFTAFFRPIFWGFYFLDFEQGYSFFWNVKVFGLLISTFLMLMLLTGNSVLLSITGGIWILLSSATQWWLSTPLPEYVISLSLIFVGLVYIFYSNNKMIQILTAISLLPVGYSFATSLYPPWQIPTVYFLISILIGYVASNFDKEILLKHITLKISIIFVLLTAFGVVLYLTYLNLHDTIEIMVNTVYPGKRNLTGGGIEYFTNLFQGYYSWYFDDSKLPQKWGNISEASGFVMMFPIVLYVTMRDLILKNKINWLLTSLSAVIILCLVWILAGLPSFIAKTLLLNLIHPGRLLVMLGIPSIISVIILLSNINQGKITFGKTEKYGILGFLVVFLLIHANTMNSNADGFFKTNQLITAGLYIIGLNALMLYNFKYNSLIFSILMVAFLGKNITINPAMKGLDPLMKNEILLSAKAIHDQDPKSKWMVFGNFTLNNFLKAGGIDVIGGATYIPDFKILRTFDRQGIYDTIYNR